MEKVFKIYVSRVLYGYSLTYSISASEKDFGCAIPVLNHGASDADRTELMKSILRQPVKTKDAKLFLEALQLPIK